MKTKTINKTENYAQFERSDENRAVDMRKHKNLLTAMERYGFLASFPIVCQRIGSRLIVKDGQHRLQAAETLGLPVHWVEEDQDFDVAVVNSTAKTWAIQDYIEKHAANGLADYQEGMVFAHNHNLGAASAFALLAGQASISNVAEAIKAGTFEIKDRKWAASVAGIYTPLVQASPKVKGVRLLMACMAVCRTPNFEARRLINNANRCREKFITYSSRDGYLTLLEEVYNFGRSEKVPLKINATNAMKARNVAKSHEEQGSL